MDLKQITTEYVESRRTALMGLAGERNLRMDEMEKLYLLDVWPEDAIEGETRVASPRAWNTVEGFRTLLLTQPPVISVPESEVDQVLQDQADTIEKYLYGAWEQADVMAAADDAEWYANALGLGVLRTLYDSAVAEGDFPIIVQALDPRTVYPRFDTRRRWQANELVHTFERPRREVEDEWGVELEAPGGTMDRQAWLDEDCDYTEYWKAAVVEVEEEIAPEVEEEPLGILGRMARALRTMVRPEPPAEEEAEPETRKVRRLRVIHCVVADGDFVKEPLMMPGYSRIPFFFWAGVRTPLGGADGALSVLFPLAGGAATGDNVSGVLGAENQLLAMELRIVEMFANAAIYTEDTSLTELDWNPGAVNYVRGSVNFLMPPGPHPAVEQLAGKLASLADDASLPPAMRGQYVGDVSGLYLTAITNPVLMKIAMRQRDRERALEDLNALMLALTEEYAPADGWTVYGRDARAGDFETRLRPDEIGGYRRNRVKLSASLPKDEAGLVMGIAALVRDRLMSRRTAIDQIQQVKRLPGQSPEDEMRQILVESIILEEQEPRKALAQQVLAEFSSEMAALVQPPPAPPSPGPGPGGPMPPMGQGQGPMGPPMPPGGPGGPMMGMPPGVVPPGAVPQAVGGQDLASMLQMQEPGNQVMPPRRGGL